MTSKSSSIASIQTMLHRAVPIVVCFLTAAVLYHLYRNHPAASGIQGMVETKEYVLSPLETVRLASLEVAQGQRVERNQVLAILDGSVLEQETRIAELKLHEIESQVRAENQSLETEGLEKERTFHSDLEKAETALNSAKFSCDQTHAELSGIQDELVRQQRLVERHLTSAERMHELGVKRASLVETMESCPSRIAALGNVRQAARQRLTDWRTSLGKNPGRRSSRLQLEPLGIQIVRQEEAIRLLKLRFANLILRSPVNGYVSAIHAMRGSTVTSGTPVLTVIEANPQQVIAYLDETIGCPLIPGNSVRLLPRNRSGSMAMGTVYAISTTVSRMPEHLWIAPSRPRWGKQIFIRTEPNRSIGPGEVFDIIPSLNDLEMPQ